jgi:pimeloyl-ACP methyl ester carboxylesterase
MKTLPKLALILSSLTVAAALTVIGIAQSSVPKLPTATESGLDARFSDKTATINGYKIHYVSGGTGEAVVLLHGWPETWYEWRKIMPALADRYTVIAPDLRGLGSSTGPSGVQGYDKKTVADDVFKLVSGLGFKTAFLVGHDVGGMTAYSLAATHPTFVKSLTVMDVPIPGLMGWDQFLQNFRPFHFGFHASPDIAVPLVTGRERLYTSWFIDSQAYNKTAITDDVRDVYGLAYSNPSALRAGFAYYANFSQDDKDNKELSKTKLSMPVMALEGSRRDEGGKTFLLGSQLRTVSDNLRDIAIPKTGHWIAEENPAFLTQTLLEFFAGK